MSWVDQPMLALKYVQTLLKNPDHYKILRTRASLVAQWLGIRLPMQGTRVGSLAREDPTRHRATKPMSYNY